MSATAITASPPRTTTAIRGTLRALRNLALNLGIVVVAYLIATYFRETLPFGASLHGGYQGVRLLPLLCCAGAMVAATLLLLLIPVVSPALGRRRFVTPLLGGALGVVALSFFDPDPSVLVRAYFAAGVLGLTLLFVPWPTEKLYEPATRKRLRRLYVNRSLLRIWVQYNVQSRYAQAILGILWIILLPLANALVMTVVFSQLLRIYIPHVPFIVFFLSALVPWGLFNQGIAAGMRSIIGAMGLINQIYFPREIIVLSALGEAVVDTVFMFVAMLIIDAVVGVFPNQNYVYLPLILLIQLLFTAGLMFIVSCVSVIVRDVPQLVSVLLQVLFYLCPIIYPESAVPARYHFIFTLDPLATLIGAYRAIIIYNQSPDWVSLLYPTAVALGIFVFGYRYFKANEETFADMI